MSAARATTPSRGALVGFRPLLRVSLRQDLKGIAPWVLLISALSGSSVLVYPWIFPDQQSRAELAVTVATNPAFSLIFGPARDLMSADGFNAWRAGALGGFFAGLMAILVVVRNSRAHEDSGQAELIASGVVGRQTRLGVAVAIAWVASLILGVLAPIVTISLGGSFVDSVTLAATFTASGFMFSGVAALTAQLASDARSASAMAVTVLGVAFVGRGFVDTIEAPEWTIWLTPLGWTQEVRVASDNRWWPLLVCLAFALGMALIAAVVQARRDFGLGLVPPRPGPSRAGLSASPWMLALRLNRAAVASWMFALAALGVVFGFLATTVGDLLVDNPQFAQIVAAGGASEEALTFEFLVTLLKLVGIIGAVFGVSLAVRVHAEEVEHRVEPLLATALSRPRYLASNAVVAWVAPAVAVTLAGTTLAVTASAVKPSVQVADVLQQALATIPATLTHVALALALVGAEPSRRFAAWMAVVASFVLTILGPLFTLRDWVLGISPFWHVPNVVRTSPDWSGLGWLALFVAGFTAVAFAGFRRRDVG